MRNTKHLTLEQAIKLIQKYKPKTKSEEHGYFMHKFWVDVREGGKSLGRVRRSIQAQKCPAPWIKETRTEFGMPFLVFYKGQWRVLHSDAGNLTNAAERNDSYLQSLFIEITEEVIKMKSMNELNDLWTKLGDIPVNEKDEIDEPFLHFEKGTDKETIWHWFEDQNPKFMVGRR